MEAENRSALPAPAAWAVQCGALCAGAPGRAEVLNRSCFCVAFEPGALRTALDTAMGQQLLPADFTDTHRHLFATLPVYLSQVHVDRIAEVVRAVEAASLLSLYRERVLSWAPGIARFDPGPPGGLLGLDFHLSPDGPKLIEINTNPGGILLNMLAAKALHFCMPDTLRTPIDIESVEHGIIEAMLAEWAAQRGERKLSLVAIVDQAPESQYLYPEFELFRQLFLAHGVRAEICDPGQLAFRGGRIEMGAGRVDMVYNRLTDFALEEPAQADLRAAYLAGGVVLTPNPRAHAMYADKRNLILMGDAGFLQQAGLDRAMADLLASAVPETVLLTPDNRDALWQQRRDLFFKPAGGYGSKASYRGDKMTKGVWADIAGKPYIAQQLVPPSERQMGLDAAALKADIRCYAYRGTPLMFAARLYQGQTTNFRTPGGGFAPVLVAAR